MQAMKTTATFSKNGEGYMNKRRRHIKIVKNALPVFRV